MAPPALLLKFKGVDTANSVTRATMKKMSEALGFNDTQLVQYALARLRAEVLPAYSRVRALAPMHGHPHPRHTSWCVASLVTEAQRPCQSLQPRGLPRAVLAHEECHRRAEGQRQPTHDRPDGERVLSVEHAFFVQPYGVEKGAADD